MKRRRKSRMPSSTFITPRSTSSRSAFRVHRSSLVFKSPWGWIGLEASERGITRVTLTLNAQQPPVRRKPGHTEVSDRHTARWLEQAHREIQHFLSGKLDRFTCPVDVTDATSFQRAVWRAAAHIPYGRVRSYQWIAARLGKPQAARAVGHALGANPVPLVIPCHRVIAADASLGGFSCGLQWKRRLLELEGSLGRLGAKVKFKVKN